MRLTKTVVLVGMMGAGKTAVGQSLARRLRVAFRDSDQEIVRAANREIAEIFARDGEAFFRLKERQVIARLLDGPAGILATGGGAYLDAGTRAAIARAGVALWLDADPALLWERVRHKTTRPLLQGADPRGTLAALHARRVPVYAQAELSVAAAPGLSVAATTEAVIAALAARPDVLAPGPEEKR